MAREKDRRSRLSSLRARTWPHCPVEGIDMPDPFEQMRVETCCDTDTTQATPGHPKLGHATINMPQHGLGSGLGFWV